MKRNVLKRLYESLVEFVSHDPLTLAASIAFYAALSFAPLIVISLWLATGLLPGVEQSLIDQLGILLGSQVRESTLTIMENAGDSPIRTSASGVLSLVVLAISATTAFAQLQASINVVWGTTGSPAGAAWVWVRRRLLSFGMLAVLGFLLMVTLVASSAIGLVLTRQSAIWTVLNELITLGLFTLGFGLLFRFVPDARLSYRFTFIGGALTAILFELGKWGLAAYLASTTTADAYGAASSLILLLIWVYYSSLIVLIGAALTRTLAEAFGERIRQHPETETRTGSSDRVSGLPEKEGVGR